MEKKIIRQVTRAREKDALMQEPGRRPVTSDKEDNTRYDAALDAFFAEHSNDVT